MSGEKATNPCNKFQANIFNKSKCQNCFKSRELHLLTDHDMGQAKPIYGGWLCLAPEGTDFDNPMQRSRKWQRRFFILYENGSLTFALDELPSTLPQGTVNMNLCTEVTDAEPRTSQRNALCVITPEQEIFIRGENKEIINGWSEQLAVYPRINRQSLKKKRKVEPVATQEPSPAKMAATGPSFPNAEGYAEPGSRPRQEEQLGTGPDITPVWTVTDTDAPGPDRPPAGDMSRCLCPVSREPPALDSSWLTGTIRSSVGSLDSVASTDPGGDSQPAAPEPRSDNNHNHTSTHDNDQTESRSYRNQSETPTGAAPAIPRATDNGQETDRADSRKGRSEARGNKREKLQSCGDAAHLAAPPPQRRAKSLDRRTSESIMTPDLLNFKKGWMVKLDKDDQWKKYWFVLSTASLRYYKDSIAEEASDLEGEIGLTNCFNVSEYQVHRNYGFQIHTQKGVYTLSAMTAGIRRNWIQALMKNVHPSNAPDVASLPGHHNPRCPTEALPKPDVTRDSSSSQVPAERDQHPKPRSVIERRREGRYNTFDWAEFRPLTKPAPEPDARDTENPCPPEPGDPERRKRREERRKRYESMLGFPLTREATGGRNAGEAGARARSPRSQKKVEEEIEEIWRQVERAAFRPENVVPLYAEVQDKDTAELDGLLDIYRKGVEDLKARLAESDHRRLELEAQLSAAGYHQQQVCPPPDPTLSSEADLGPLGTNEKPLNSHAESLTDMYRETRELLQQQNTIRQSMQGQLGLALSLTASQHSPGWQTPSIWLHDTEGNLREMGDLLSGCPGTLNTPLLSPDSDSQDSLLQSEGEPTGPNMDSKTTSHHTQLDREVHHQGPSSETQVNSSEWSADPLITEETGERDGDFLSCCETLSCVEEHIDPEQAMVRRLSQEVEMLTSQNEALNQRNQEMLNQLTEADREIERLKAEVSMYSEPCHLPQVEQLSQTKAECLEKELSVRNQQLLEAQSLITSLENRLRDAETQLQLGEATLQALGIPDKTEEAGEENTDMPRHGTESEGYLLRCFEATEAKLTVLERQLRESELTCRQLQAHNAELMAVERLYSQRASEAEADIRRLNEELENRRLKEGEKLMTRNISVSGEERIQQVIEGMTMRSKALRKLLEVIDRSDIRVIRRSVESGCEEVKPMVVSHLQWEEEFWRALLNALKASSSQPDEEKLIDVLLSEVAEHMVVEKQMLLLAYGLLSETDSRLGREGLLGACDGEPLEDLDIIGNFASVTVSEYKEKEDNSGTLDLNNQHHDTDKSVRRCFTDIAQMKVSLLSYIASSVGASANDKLQFAARRLCDFHVSEHPWIDFIYSAATEALHCCLVSRLHSAHHGEPEEAKRRALPPPLICSSCAGLMRADGELRDRTSTNPDARRCPWEGEGSPALGQPEVADAAGVSAIAAMEEGNLQTPEETAEGESLLDGDDIPVLSVEGPRGTQEAIRDEDAELTDTSHKDTDRIHELEEVVLLRERVTELEEQLSATVEEMKGEFDLRTRSLQLQHEKDVEKLKAMCERGFASMEEAHQRVLEELQHRHQQEVEEVLRDRDRLLEEETTATVTAIAAIQKAHRLELEREVQRMHQSNNSAANPDLEDICRQHREELSSFQRELEVLSQQYCLKCLENGHLGQALDAERKALCQCQQENQDLRTRNQELSGHLAAEITRLCSLAQRDALPLSQGMDVYELEITLRVRESEVQCLKQEITSLKDELQSAQKDKRTLAKKYKDIYTEMSILKAKTERDVDQLRENLRLAHKALGETSP
ncbi:uncharacterized protein ACJ7VT_022070 [Polymixia lowei]